MKNIYVIKDSCIGDGKVIRTFPNKPSCLAWIMEGMRATEGAEQTHYVGLLLQLEEGMTELDYNGRYTY